MMKKILKWCDSHYWIVLIIAMLLTLITGILGVIDSRFVLLGVITFATTVVLVLTGLIVGFIIMVKSIDFDNYTKK